MSRYDEDTVVALLRESVPAVPDVPDRVALIRHKAGSQRAALWTQALGAVASVLLVVGVAAAVAVPGGGGEVEPVSEPVRALSEAFAQEDSVRFAATVTPLGEYVGDEARFHEALAASVTGAATKDGDIRVDGDLSFAMMLGDVGDEDTHIRIVDGVFYRSAATFDHAPAGKRWVREDGASQTGLTDLLRLLRLAEAFVEDVRYTGGGSVRGVSVAEYRLTVPARFAGGQMVAVTFALDGEDRLRRVTAELSYRMLINPGMGRQGNPLDVRVELLLHGYGDDVDIEAPPAAETITAADLEAASADERRAAYEAMQDCLRKAGKDSEAIDACAEELGYAPGAFEPTAPEMESCREEPQPDGSFATVCSGSVSVGVGTSVGLPPPAPSSTEPPPATPVPATPAP